jgi:WD40 repeat protein
MDTNEAPRDAPDPAVPPHGEFDEPLDSQFADVLAAYDELLAVGAPSAIGGERATDAELQDAKECLNILEHVFPRNKAPSPSPLPEGEGNEPSPFPLPPRPISDPKSESIRTLGQFEIVRELGRGGGGFVFLAVDSNLGRYIALKVPYPEVLVRRDLRRRFVQEAHAAAKLDHQNIIPVYGAGEIGPVCYIVSAYCEGPTLAEWLKARDSPVPFSMAARLVAALADAVEHAHSQGILHRDIKPSNVMLEEQGARSEGQGADATPCSPLLAPCPMPKLMDFGLAKSLEMERDATRTGAVLGTPTYMAPEQAEGRLADIDVTTDVYGLGVVLYELIAGRPPFRGENDLETLHSISRDDPPQLRQFRDRVPRDLEAICLKCLEKKSSIRYQRAAELAADLRRFLDKQPTFARPVGWVGRTVRWARRQPAAAAACVTLLLAAVSTFLALSWHENRIGRLESTAKARIQLLADGERERTRRYEYATHVQGAHQAWQSADLKSAIELLDRGRPKAGEEDLRGWEWYYVRRLCAGGLVTLRGHVGPVLGAVFAPEGERLASCGADGTLRIWNASDGAEIVSIPAHRGPANAIAWSTDGLLLATVGDDSFVRIRDAETRKLRTELQVSPGKLLSVAFSPDSRLVAAAGENGAIRIWNVVSGDSFRTIQAHADTIHSVAFSPEGDRIASGSADRTARVWNVHAAGEPLAVFGPTFPVFSVAFSPDGRILATADQHIRFWDLSRREEIGRVNIHENQLRSIAFAPDGRTIASAADDLLMCTWELTPPFDPSELNDAIRSARRLRHIYRGHTNAVLCVAFSPLGNRVASADKDGVIQIWDPTRPQDRQPLALGSQKAEAYAVAFSPAENTLAAATRIDDRCEVLLWRPPDRSPATAIPLPEDVVDAIYSMVFSSHGNSLALAINGGPVIACDIRQGENRTLVGQYNSYSGCAISPDGNRLAVASHKPNSTRIYDITTGEVLAHIPGQRSVAFSPDGRLLATESANVDEFFPVELWDILARKSVGRLVGHKAQIDSIAFSSDGDLLATGSSDGTARLWNLEDRTEQMAFRAHSEGVRRVAFLPDKKRLATASADGKVKIWDVATGRELLTLDVASGKVDGMAVSADGRTIATASIAEDGKHNVDLWNAPDEKRE